MICLTEFRFDRILVDDLRKLRLPQRGPMKGLVMIRLVQQRRMGQEQKTKHALPRNQEQRFM